MPEAGGYVRNRTASLDGLRGVAIAIVLVYHVRAVYAASVESVMPGGFLGVDLFFVLSGFLITGLLLQEHRRRSSVRLGAFYRRRVLRLYPALALVLVAHALYASYAHIPSSIERSSLQSIFFYYFNWRQTLLIPEGVGHMWSLSVEEQFYLFWPVALLLLLWLTRARTRYIAPVVGAAIVVVLVYRAWRWQDGMPWLWIYQRTDTRVDALLMGALLALIFGGLDPGPRFFERNRWISPAAWVATGVFVACILLAHRDESFLYVGGFTLVAAACAVLVIAALPGSPWTGARSLRFRPLCVLGTVSYGLYLWHFPVFVGVERYGQSIAPPLRVGLALALTAAFTTMSWFLVEQPFLRWKDRLEARARTDAPTPAASTT